MTHYLARPEDQVRTDWLKRFDAAHWTLNFPRPMMAAATVPQPGTLKVDLAFLKANDLAGLIWESEDSRSHPLLSYETKRDYRGMFARFRWRSEGGAMPLDRLNGPVLTIEGRDESGMARTWYVRLWNYAAGSPTDALVTIDFDALEGGYLLPGEADPVWAGDIDRMFISLVPAGFTGADEALAEPVEVTVWLEDIHAEGKDAAIALGDACVPPHRLRMATGYDDQYNLTPTRVLRTMRALGYRDWLTLYVGMSHFMRLQAGGAGAFEVAEGGDPLCGPARAWFADLAAKAAAEGVTIIWSLSYELFDEYAPEGWKQRAHDGSPALTGWSPPSTLLSPANGEAMGWLQGVAAELVKIGAGAGMVPWFQIGEPWWWTGFGEDQRPCIYDAAAVAAYGGEHGELLTELPETLSAEQTGYVDWLGERLGASVLALRDAAKAAAIGVKTALLFYAPQVLGSDAPWLKALNMPAAWGSPTFDVLQLEDYDFVIEGQAGESRAAVAAVEQELGYPAAAQDYFSGFVLSGEDAALWHPIAAAAESAMVRGVRETFVWALPQAMRDGFTYFDLETEAPVQAFHDVSFPLDVGEGASGGPEFLTQVAETVSGAEQRASVWASGRLRFDAGTGVRSEADLIEVLRFFRARKGRAHGFRFRDLLDFASSDDGEIGPFDQVLGTADGARTDFPLVKRYGSGEDAEVRRITRPETASVVVAVDGAAADGWTLEEGGLVRFLSAPVAGLVTAGFRFDVPVRFGEDVLSASLGSFRAGEIPSIPLVEVREALG